MSSLHPLSDCNCERTACLTAMLGWSWINSKLLKLSWVAVGSEDPVLKRMTPSSCHGSGELSQNMMQNEKFKIFGLVASRWRQFGSIFGIHCLIAVLLPHLTFQTYTCGSRLWHQRTLVTGIHCSRSQFSIYPAVRICMTLVYPVLVLRTLTMQAHQNGAVNCKRPQFKRDSDMSKGFKGLVMQVEYQVWRKYVPDFRR